MRESPLRPMRLMSFYLSRSEVTVGQYRRCVRAGACVAPRACEGGHWSARPGDRETHPISCVTWEEAARFAAWIGGALPSESQWVWAARGVERRLYPWGAEPLSCERVRFRSLERRCNADESCPIEPVCHLPAGESPEGLCDLAGSLREFLSDHFSAQGLALPIDGSPLCPRDGCAGGSVYSTRGQSDCLPSGYELTRRGASPAGERSGDLGFRVARRAR